MSASSSSSFQLSLEFPAIFLIFERILSVSTQCSLKWLSHRRNPLKATLLCLLILERLLRFTTWNMTTIYERKYMPGWIKSRFKIILCATSMGHIAARCPSCSATKATNMRAAWYPCTFRLPLIRMVHRRLILWTPSTACSFWKEAGAWKWLVALIGAASTKWQETKTK